MIWKTPGISREDRVYVFGIELGQLVHPPVTTVVTDYILDAGNWNCREMRIWSRESCFEKFIENLVKRNWFWKKNESLGLRYVLRIWSRESTLEKFIENLAKRVWVWKFIENLGLRMLWESGRDNLDWKKGYENWPKNLMSEKENLDLKTIMRIWKSD